MTNFMEQRVLTESEQVSAGKIPQLFMEPESTRVCH